VIEAVNYKLSGIYQQIVVTLCRFRTTLALGYWVLSNISQYWVVLGTGQYFSGLWYPLPILPTEF